MAAVLIALAASSCWGVADFLGGLQTKQIAVPVVLCIIEGTGLVLVLVVIAATAEPLPGMRAIILSVVAAWRASWRWDASNPVMTVVLASAFLGERIRRVQQAGVVAAIAGVAMIAAG